MTVFTFRKNTALDSLEIHKYLKSLGLRCAGDVDPQYNEEIDGRKIGNGVFDDGMFIHIVVHDNDVAAFRENLATIRAKLNSVEVEKKGKVLKETA